MRVTEQPESVRAFKSNLRSGGKYSVSPSHNIMSWYQAWDPVQMLGEHFNNAESKKKMTESTSFKLFCWWCLLVYLLDGECPYDVFSQWFRLYQGHLNVSVHLCLIWPVTHTFHLEKDDLHSCYVVKYVLHAGHYLQMSINRVGWSRGQDERHEWYSRWIISGFVLLLLHNREDINYFPILKIMI